MSQRDDDRDDPKGGSSVLPWIGAGTAIVTLGAGAWGTWLLYDAQRPFHADYLTSTPAANASVTIRICLAMFAVPLGLAGLQFWSWGEKTVGRALRLLSAWLILAGLHAEAIWLQLPYGFGSGYENATASQLLHLNLTIYGGLGLVVVGVAAAILAAIARGPDRVKAY